MLQILFWMFSKNFRPKFWVEQNLLKKSKCCFFLGHPVYIYLSPYYSSLSLCHVSFFAHWKSSQTKTQWFIIPACYQRSLSLSLLLLKRSSYYYYYFTVMHHTHLYILYYYGFSAQQCSLCWGFQNNAPSQF